MNFNKTYTYIHILLQFFDSFFLTIEKTIGKIENRLKEIHLCTICYQKVTYKKIIGAHMKKCAQTNLPTQNKNTLLCYSVKPIHYSLQSESKIALSCGKVGDEAQN